jgi:hypothetical protein
MGRAPRRRAHGRWLATGGRWVQRRWRAQIHWRRQTLGRAQTLARPHARSGGRRRHSRNHPATDGTRARTGRDGLAAVRAMGDTGALDFGSRIARPVVGAPFSRDNRRLGCRSLPSQPGVLVAKRRGRLSSPDDRGAAVPASGMALEYGRLALPAGRVDGNDLTRGGGCEVEAAPLTTQYSGWNAHCAGGARPRFVGPRSVPEDGQRDRHEDPQEEDHRVVAGLLGMARLISVGAIEHRAQIAFPQGHQGSPQDQRPR